MDYDRVPNVSSYPPAAKSDSVPGFSGPDAIPTGPSMLDDIDREQTRRKIVYTFVFIIFGMVSVLAIGYFVYQNSEQAAASEDQTLIVRNSKTNPLAKPTESFDDLFAENEISTAPTLQAEPVSETISPTVASQKKATATPFPLATRKPTVGPVEPTTIPTNTPVPTNKPQPTSSRTTFWNITFSKNSYSPADLTKSGTHSYVASGKLYSPVAENTVICITEEDTFFTKKKDDSTVERLCSVAAPTTSKQCYKYNDSIGIPVAATISQRINCSTPEMPESGTYVMVTKAYYNCDGSAGVNNVNLTTCSSNKEVFSDDFNLQ